MSSCDSTTFRAQLAAFFGNGWATRAMDRTTDPASGLQL
jgi:hypothetical protein